MFLTLCELFYNNSYHSIIYMALFETLYGKGSRSPIGLFEVVDMKPRRVDLIKFSQNIR